MYIFEIGFFMFYYVTINIFKLLPDICLRKHIPNDIMGKITANCIRLIAYITHCANCFKCGLKHS